MSGSVDVRQQFKTAHDDAAQTPPRLRRRSKAPPPFSLRLTEAERTFLEQASGTMPVGAYIRSRLFGPGKALGGGRRRTRRPVVDHPALSQLLAKLGEARLANNLNQLARAANTGSLPVTPETEQALCAAVAEVGWMRAMLLRALGLKAAPRTARPSISAKSSGPTGDAARPESATLSKSLASTAPAETEDM